mmetsp:Transcript_2201/g.5269  ORF Transcript_2201/g.5269 Transcript_2201/m.5269 type:complete len:201 (+) Transcript_2201:1429-2031(+)
MIVGRSSNGQASGEIPMQNSLYETFPWSLMSHIVNNRSNISIFERFALARASSNPRRVIIPKSSDSFAMAYRSASTWTFFRNIFLATAIIASDTSSGSWLSLRSCKKLPFDDDFVFPILKKILLRLIEKILLRLGKIAISRWKSKRLSYGTTIRRFETTLSTTLLDAVPLFNTIQLQSTSVRFDSTTFSSVSMFRCRGGL